MLISIITVNYNNLSGLEKTYRSIAGQRCRDFEWIVIDGGSTDGSREFLQQHSSEIAYWVSEPDKGIYHAMNKGVESAKGEYLNFLNSGDAYFDTEVLADFAAFDSKADVVYGYDKVVDSAGNVTWTWTAPEIPIQLDYFLRGNSVRHQSTFVARRCFDSLRYNEAHKINSDHELFMTLYYRNYKFEYFDRCVVLFDGEGISSRTEYLTLYQNEVNDSIGRLLPEGIKRDYQRKMRENDLDIIVKARQIVDSNKIMRHLLRVAIYPLAWLAKFIK